MKKIIVIGAGASGMMAAIAAAENHAQVLVLERMERPGKKILATGNGRCNFTNSYLEAECYHENSFAMDVVGRFDRDRTIDFMKETGIFPTEKNGYYYPLSGQASSVADLLKQRMDRLGIRTECSVYVKEISRNPSNGRFTVLAEKTVYSGVKEKVKKNGKKKMSAVESHTEPASFTADAVILAAGGMAAPKLGSDGSGYGLAGKAGHHLVKPVPALTGIVCEEPWFAECAGVRISANVSILVEGKKTAEAAGELQLADYGISGIVVFQVSRYAARALADGKNVKAVLEFYPEIPMEEKKKFCQGRKISQLSGFYPDKLLEVLKKISPDDPFAPVACTPKEMIGFDRAQVTCGGIPVNEVNPLTMESKKCPGLYLCGEILDVDGICGGYNLQWAWSSGHAAGEAAAGFRKGDSHD